MRHVKFRIFNKHCKNMIYNTEMAMRDMFENGFLTEDEHRYLMQYTGLKDIQEREIYEGDIVRDESNEDYVVYYDNDFASFVFKPIGTVLLVYSMVDLMTENKDELNIIGNIYENPELLEI